MLSEESVLVLIKFKIWGNLRFLSHAETIRVFQRACLRAAIEIRYSRGFNPRPRISLPLPRSVGVESDDELLSLRLNRKSSNDEQRDANNEIRIKARIAGQLPDGCELISLETAESKTSPQAVAATYVLVAQQKYLDEKLKARIKRLLASESLNIKRRINAKGDVREVDVRGFLKSIKLDNGNIIVECIIDPAGSIRVDEILRLLELDTEMLAAPVRRTNVQWQVQ